MNATTTARVAAAAILGALAVTVPATAAHAVAPSNGCPGTYALVSTEIFDKNVYRVPDLMDDVLGSFGNPPLSDNLVCARTIPGRVVGGYQVYNFLDNTLPASSDS